MSSRSLAQAEHRLCDMRVRMERLRSKVNSMGIDEPRASSPKKSQLRSVRRSARLLVVRVVPAQGKLALQWQVCILCNMRRRVATGLAAPAPAEAHPQEVRWYLVAALRPPLVLRAAQARSCQSCAWRQPEHLPARRVEGAASKSTRKARGSGSASAATSRRGSAAGRMRARDQQTPSPQPLDAWRAQAQAETEAVSISPVAALNATRVLLATERADDGPRR